MINQDFLPGYLRYGKKGKGKAGPYREFSIEDRLEMAREALDRANEALAKIRAGEGKKIEPVKPVPNAAAGKEKKKKKPSLRETLEQQKKAKEEIEEY